MSAPQPPAEQDVRTPGPGSSPPRDEAAARQALQRRGGPSTPPGPPKSARSTPPRAEAPTGELPASDRAVDADLLVDIPQLSVEELNLELEASVMLKRIKLDAKGLEASLFLKSDLDSLAELAAGRSSAAEHDRPRGGATRARGGLRELLGSARDVQPDPSQSDAGEDTAPPADASDRDAGGEERAQEDSNGLQQLGERASRVAKQGAKAVGLTAAGLAGGALLESRLQPSRGLPLPRRRSRTHALVHDIRRRLP